MYMQTYLFSYLFSYSTLSINLYSYTNIHLYSHTYMCTHMQEKHDSLRDWPYAAPLTHNTGKVAKVLTFSMQSLLVRVQYVLQVSLDELKRGDITLYCGVILVVSCFVWSGALDSSDLLLSYLLMSLAYTDNYYLINTHIYISVGALHRAQDGRPICVCGAVAGGDPRSAALCSSDGRSSRGRGSCGRGRGG